MSLLYNNWKWWKKKRKQQRPPPPPQAHLYYNGCPYTGNIFTFKNRITEHKIIFTLKSVIVSFSYSVSGFFYDTNFQIFFTLPFHSLSIVFFSILLSESFTSGPIGRAGCPLAALSGHDWRPGGRRALPRTGAPPLWLLCWGPEPRPRCDGGSWPESQSGVGGGTGRAGEVGGCPAAAPLFLAGAGAGTMDSSRDLLFAGSPSSPPVARSAISFLAATRLAFDVRRTPSPAQMLVPSTVVRS